MANIYVSTGTSFSATLNITYPSGSTCTVANYKKTRTAPNTSGTWACKVDEVGYYTVKCVSGSNTATKVVAVTTNKQSITVKLVYWDGTVYNAGDEYTEQTGGWEAFARQTQGSETQDFYHNAADKYMLLQCAAMYDNWSGLACGTVNKINLSGKTTLHLNGTMIGDVTGTTGPPTVRLGITTASTKPAFDTLRTETTWKAITGTDNTTISNATYSLPSGVTSAFIYVLAWNVNVTTNKGIKMTKIWLT